MADVHETTELKLDPDTAWQRIGDFGAVGDWHPMLARVDSDGNAPGDLRRAAGKDGSTQVERLDAYDGKAHVYRYTLVETALPVSDYHAEFRIDPAGAGASTVTWSARFVANGDERAAIDAVRPFFKAGIDALAQRYG
jgi:mxaD protein